MTDAPDPQPNLGLMLGLGRHWTPGPGGWEWHEVANENGQKMHVLSIATTGGTAAILLDQDALRRLASQATERATGGLALAQPQVVRAVQPNRHWRTP